MFYKPIDVHSVKNVIGEIDINMIFLVATYFFVGRQKKDWKGTFPYWTNRNDLDLILGRRNRNCCIMENLRHVFCCKWNIFINLCWITKTSSETSYRHSHKHMLTLNANLDCQVRVIRKNFAFTKTWKYITKLHDPNKKKMGLPYFD